MNGRTVLRGDPESRLSASLSGEDPPEVSGAQFGRGLWAGPAVLASRSGDFGLRSVRNRRVLFQPPGPGGLLTAAWADEDTYLKMPALICLNPVTKVLQIFSRLMSFFPCIPFYFFCCIM